jgi:hypothetical protein
MFSIGECVVCEWNLFFIQFPNGAKVTNIPKQILI